MTVLLSNSGSAPNPSTELQFSDFDDYVDVVGCTPTCATDTLLGDVYAEVEGVAAGASLAVTVEFVGTAVGAAQWSLCVYDDADGGDQVYCGDATTVIR